jgi:hypothetical protein
VQESPEFLLDAGRDVADCLFRERGDAELAGGRDQRTVRSRDERIG